MEKHELKIIVAGRPTSGKTTMAVYLTRLLEEAGFSVEFAPDPMEHDMATVQRTFDERIKVIKNTKRISVEMLMLPTPLNHVIQEKGKK